MQHQPLEFLTILVLATGCSSSAAHSDVRSPARPAPAERGPTSETMSETKAERELFALVNQHRQLHHSPALAWHEIAARVARQHSTDMMRRNTVAHESPTTGAPADRVRHADIHVPVVMENVARASTVTEAHLGLINSPGHLANILSTEATHLGVGIVKTTGPNPQIFVTQLFLRVLQSVDLSAARQSLRDEILVSRRRSHATPVRSSELLEHSAQSLALAFAAKHGSLDDDTRRRLLAPAAQKFSATRAVLAVVSAVTAVAADKGVLAPAEAYGVGLAQGTHADIGDNALFVVVLLANR